MEQVTTLITALEQCVPGIDTKPLTESAPNEFHESNIISWLYDNLSQQGLMDYFEWMEYCGYMPEIETVSDIKIEKDIGEYILEVFNQVEKEQGPFEEDTQFMLPHLLPWLEHINHYLAKYKLRLISFAPFENAYVLGVNYDDKQIEQLNLALNESGISVIPYKALNEQQVVNYIKKLDEIA